MIPWVRVPGAWKGAPRLRFAAAGIAATLPAAFSAVAWAQGPGETENFELRHEVEPGVPADAAPPPPEEPPASPAPSAAPAAPPEPAPEPESFTLGPAGAGAGAPSPLAFQMRMQPSLGVNSRFAVDTRWNNDVEDVLFWRNQLTLGAAVDWTERVQIALNGRLTHSAWQRRYRGGCVFVFTSGEACRADYEPELLEAYAAVAFPGLDLRVGNQIFNWSVVDTISPLDILNPTDLRDAIIPIPDPPKIPVPAVSVRADWGDFAFQAVWEPFYVPSRNKLIGSDYAALQTNFPVPLPLPLDDVINLMGPAMKEGLESGNKLVAAQDEALANSQGGVRTQYRGADFDAALSYWTGFDSVPRLEIAPEVVRLAMAASRIAAAGGYDWNLLTVRRLANESPALARDLAALDRRLDAGLPVIELAAQRIHNLGGGGTYAWEDFIFKAETAWSPKRLTYDTQLRPREAQAWSLTAGAEYNYGEPLLLMVEYFQTMMFAPGGPALLIYGQRGFLNGIAVVARSTLLLGHLELTGLVVYNFTLLDVLASPQVKYKFDDHHAVTAGAEILHGPDPAERLTPGGYWTRNDNVWVMYSYGY